MDLRRGLSGKAVFKTVTVVMNSMSLLTSLRTVAMSPSCLPRFGCLISEYRQVASAVKQRQGNLADDARSVVLGPSLG